MGNRPTKRKRRNSFTQQSKKRESRPNKQKAKIGPCPHNEEFGIALKAFLFLSPGRGPCLKKLFRLP